MRLGSSLGNYNYLNGALDEFRIWNFVKTAADISTQYQNELSGNETGLILYYKFDETASSLCYLNDCSPFRYDALVYNGSITASIVPNLMDMACGTDPSVSNIKEFIGRKNGGCEDSWDNVSNWSPSGVPSSSDNVLIRHGLVKLNNSNNDISVNSLTIDGWHKKWRTTANWCILLLCQIL